MANLSALAERAARRVYAVGSRIAPTHLERYKVGRYTLSNVAPFPVADAGSPYLARSTTALPGVDLREDQALALLERWANTTSESDFAALRSNPGINLEPRSGGIFNGYYDTPDPELYFRMIGEYRPSRIVEIGGGFSTLVARTAIRHYELDTELMVIDPQPRTAVRDAVDTLILDRVESIDPARVVGGAGELLFIDSSHILRTGGDLPYLFGQVVPSVPVGTRIHVHDIFLPYDYSPRMAEAMYNEQYLLQALLAHTPRYRVVFPTHCISRRHPEAMRSVFGDPVGALPEYHGSSFWMDVV